MMDGSKLRLLFGRSDAQKMELRQPGWARWRSRVGWARWTCVWTRSYLWDCRGEENEMKAVAKEYKKGAEEE